MSNYYQASLDQLITQLPNIKSSLLFGKVRKTDPQKIVHQKQVKLAQENNPIKPKKRKKRKRK